MASASAPTLDSPSVGSIYPVPTSHWAYTDTRKLTQAPLLTLCTSLALDTFIASGCGLSLVVYGLGQTVYKCSPKSRETASTCHPMMLFPEMKRTVIKCCIGGGRGRCWVGNMHHKKHNGLMLINRLASAQGCLLSSHINIGEAPRRQTFLFLWFDGRGGWAYFFLYFSTVIPLGIPPICLRLKPLSVLQLPVQLDSWKDWRYQRICGCIPLPDRVSQFKGFYIIHPRFCK